MQFLIFGALILCLGLILGCGQETKLEEKEFIRPVKFLKVGDTGAGMSAKYSGKIKAAQEKENWIQEFLRFQ